MFPVGTMKEHFWRPLCVTFYIIDFACREHQMHMRMTLAARHRSNFFMDCPGVVMIFHVTREKCVKDFAILRKRQLVRQ